MNLIETPRWLCLAFGLVWVSAIAHGFVAYASDGEPSTTVPNPQAIVEEAIRAVRSEKYPEAEAFAAIALTQASRGAHESARTLFSQAITAPGGNAFYVTYSIPVLPRLLGVAKAQRMAGYLDDMNTSLQLALSDIQMTHRNKQIDIDRQGSDPIQSKSLQLDLEIETAEAYAVVENYSAVATILQRIFPEVRDKEVSDGSFLSKIGRASCRERV